MRFLNSQKGLTYIEMIIVVSLYTIILLAVGNSISSFYKYNAYSFAQSSQVAEARRGINRMVRDIREMTYGDEGSYPLLIMEEHKIGFYSDIDRDDSVEYVEFSVSSTTLEKNIYNATGSPPTYSTSTIAETHTLSTYVQNIPQATSTFVYYDVNGDEATATSTVTDIRYVEVRLIVNVDPIRDPGEFMLRSSSALRNLKDNL